MRRKTQSLLLIVCFLLAIPSSFGQLKDVELKIHLRGVYESKISVLAMSGTRLYKPIVEVPAVKNGETVRLVIQSQHLPGEMVLRFDYKEKAESTPYPSEKSFFAYNQNLELWVSPIYCNNQDSTWFQKEERENRTFALFSVENAKKKEKLGVLQNFLMSYDDTQSKLFQEGLNEFELRRTVYNEWLKGKGEEYRELFIRTLLYFQHVPKIAFTGTEEQRIENMIDHYFDGVNFNDTLLLKTSYLNKWMDNYVNLYGQLSTTTELRDSLFPLAGKRAIEQARKGHPLVYGWMVDYFYRGYESNAIDAGIKILEPYMNDPRCLTTKRLEINRRLEGMKTLVPGSVAPEISMTFPDNSTFKLSEYLPGSKYLLVVFWSADCEHCKQLTDALYPYSLEKDIRETFAVVAVSLDETETEYLAWEKKIKEMPGWKHLIAKEGVRSKEASDYFVLATPVMVLLEAGSLKVVAVPNTLKELQKALADHRDLK